jgi:hypothetical protein
MTFTEATRAKINTMVANGGRYVDGRWRSLTQGITCNCKNDNHDRCSGWIFPIGGANECSCPCHDDDRPDYHTARATVIKKTNWCHGPWA